VSSIGSTSAADWTTFFSILETVWLIKRYFTTPSPCPQAKSPFRHMR
jgi:hypothetical protein